MAAVSASYQALAAPEGADAARVEALKRIRPGEEIFLDYGPYFWEAVGFDKQ